MQVHSYVNIFEFARFRRYLVAYQEQRCIVEPGFTRTEFCKLLGLPNTRSYFSDIVRGKRVSKPMIDRFLGVLELNKVEARYFRAMVAFDQGRTVLAREKAFAEMQEIHPYPKSILDPDAFEYYSSWYHSALFAILDTVDAGDDLSEIENRITPHVGKFHLKESLDLLIRLNLVARNSDGFWKPTRDRISMDSRNSDILIKQYQIQCLELSKQALESNDQRPQDTSSLIFSVSDESKLKIEQAIDICKNEIYRIVAEDSCKANHVMNLNVNLASLLK